MQTLKDLERRAMDLPEADRAALASRLPGSLPAVLAEEDEGVSEALRRDAELDQNPSAGLTLDELRRSVRPK